MAPPYTRGTNTGMDYTLDHLEGVLLAYIQDEPQGTPQLARALTLPLPTLVHALRSLEQQRLIQYHPHPQKWALWGVVSPH